MQDKRISRAPRGLQIHSIGNGSRVRLHQVNTIVDMKIMHCANGFLIKPTIFILTRTNYIFNYSTLINFCDCWSNITNVLLVLTNNFF